MSIFLCVVSSSLHRHMSRCVHTHARTVVRTIVGVSQLAPTHASSGLEEQLVLHLACRCMDNRRVQVHCAADTQAHITTLDADFGFCSQACRTTYSASGRTSLPAIAASTDARRSRWSLSSSPDESRTRSSSSSTFSDSTRLQALDRAPAQPQAHTQTKYR